MRKLFTRAFVLWLPFVVAITCAVGFSYIATQQNYRQSANDPQIQIAEDAAVALERDYTPANLVSRTVIPIDIATSLAPWITIYDASGTPLESSAVLDGSPPRMPEGLLDPTTWTTHKKWVAPTGSETRVSWQPRPSVRQAVTIVQFQSPSGVGYVAVGRSMHSVEDRIINLTHDAALAWSFSVLAIFAAIFLILALGWL